MEIMTNVKIEIPKSPSPLFAEGKYYCPYCGKEVKYWQDSKTDFWHGVDNTVERCSSYVSENYECNCEDFKKEEYAIEQIKTLLISRPQRKFQIGQCIIPIK